MLKERFDNWFDNWFHKLELHSTKVNKQIDNFFPKKYKHKKIDILLTMFFANFLVSIGIMLFHLQCFWLLLVTQIVCLLIGITLALVLLDEKRAEESMSLFLLTVVHLAFFALMILT